MGFGVVFVFGSFFSFAGAQVEAQAQAQAQVQAQAQTEVKSVQTFKVNINSNDVSKKEEIRKLQGFLINQGVLNIKEPTGYFGPITKEAVKKLQRALDLPQAGVVGPLTRAKINTIIESQAKSPDALALRPAQAESMLDIKPVEIKTDLPRPLEIKPQDIKPIEIKPLEIKPLEIKPQEIKPLIQPEKIIIETDINNSIILPNSNIPRVMFWWGKVNQHINTTTGTWETDPNGLEEYAGASVDKLTYCRMFYPKTISVVPYMFETIDGWRDRGNVGKYSSTNLSYRCIEGDKPVIPVDLDTKIGITDIVKTEEVGVVSSYKYLPRVTFWWGKVNQHINPMTGAWETDPDGLQPFAGASVDKLEYCKMMYPRSTSVVPFGYVTIENWHDRGNVNKYTSTTLAYRCVQFGESEIKLPQGAVLGVSIAR